MTFASFRDKVKRTEKPEPKKIPDIDPELLARAETANVRKKDIAARGAVRRDADDTAYWFPLEALVELDELDLATDDDDVFWAGFEEIRARFDLEPQSKRVRYSGSTEKKKLSNWWSDWGYTPWRETSGTSELAQRLAIALGAITSTVNVINDTAKRWRVELASDDPAQMTSYTDYEAALVVVSPQALLDKSLDSDRQIEISTGFGLHEGGHVNDSEPTLGALEKPDRLRPMAVAGLLHNILEDVRTEKLTATRYPGFAGYLATMNSYLWTKAVAPRVSKRWEHNLNEKLSSVIAIAKWEPEYRIHAGKIDADLAVEFDWWAAWRDHYIDGSIGMRKSVEDGIARLATDPETKKQMEEQEKREKDIEDAISEFEAAMGSAIEAMKREGPGELVEPCPSPASGDPVNLGEKGKDGKPTVKITRGVAEEIRRLIREEFSIEDIPLPAIMPDRDGTGGPRNVVTKPELKPFIHPPVDPLLSRMRHVFRFRKAHPMFSNRMLRSGALDEEEMWRVLGNDLRVFEQRVVVSDPETQVTLLIDASGSMTGKNIQKAARLARLIHACLLPMKGVRVRVRAHTSEATGDSEPTNHIYRIWEPGDSPDRLHVLEQLQMTANYDGFAIAHCADEMLRESRPNEDMLMIVLADGRPSGGRFSYGGTPAIRHVRKVHDAYKAKGVNIVQLAIDRGVGDEIQAQMFDQDYICYVDDSMLPKQMTDLLIRQFGNTE